MRRRHPQRRHRPGEKADGFRSHTRIAKGVAARVTANPDNYQEAAPQPREDASRTRRHVLTAGAAAAGAALASGVVLPSTAAAQPADTSTQNTFTDKQTFAASPTF